MLKGDDCIIIIHFKRYSCVTLLSHNLVKIGGGGGGLATAFDLELVTLKATLALPFDLALPIAK